MAHRQAAPLWGQILIVLFAPPILAFVFKAMSRGWAETIQGQNVSKQTKSRQKDEFWILLWVLYAGMLAIFSYGSWLHR